MKRTKKGTGLCPTLARQYLAFEHALTSTWPALTPDDQARVRDTLTRLRALGCTS